MSKPTLWQRFRCWIFGHDWVEDAPVVSHDVDVIHRNCARCGAHDSYMRG